jgi:hypothetical protein
VDRSLEYDSLSPEGEAIHLNEAQREALALAEAHLSAIAYIEET